MQKIGDEQHLFPSVLVPLNSNEDEKNDFDVFSFDG